MNKLPISFVFFTSTKGHHRCRDIYTWTLDHYDRQLPLSSFSVKVAHLKISSGDEAIGETMQRDLERRGFEVIVTTGDWSRGTSHQNAYLLDQIKVSKHPSIYANPHLLLVEDDSPIVATKMPLDRLLARMVEIVESSPDVLSARVARRGDFPLSGKIQHLDDEVFAHEHANFQPMILRTRDFHTILKVAEDHPTQVNNIQIEMLWRLLLAPYSRSALPHIVFYPEVAESVHLGVPDYLTVKKSLGL